MKINPLDSEMEHCPNGLGTAFLAFDGQLNTIFQSLDI
jgi:hypothetical protein